MSRTESLFICMIWPANFTRYGRGGAICPIYALLSIDDAQMTKARLAMVQGVVTVLASGLGVLGVDAPNEMR